jgi:hypothetical protein
MENFYDSERKVQEQARKRAEQVRYQPKCSSNFLSSSSLARRLDHHSDSRPQQSRNRYRQGSNGYFAYASTPHGRGQGRGRNITANANVSQSGRFQGAEEQRDGYKD